MLSLALCDGKANRSSDDVAASASDMQMTLSAGSRDLEKQMLG